jgi:hypothetical protein
MGSIACKPALSPTLAIPDGHRRGVQGLVRAFTGLQKGCQVQGEGLDELCARAQEAVELRAVGQSRKGTAQATFSVAVEISLAGEPRPAGEDGKGYDLGVGEGGFWTRTLFPGYGTGKSRRP